MKKSITINEIMFNMAGGSKTPHILDLLCLGRVEEANKFYLACSSQLYDDLYAVIFHKEFFKRNILALPSDNLLMQHIKEVAFSPEKREDVLISSLSHQQATPTVLWWCEQLKTLPFREQEKSSEELVHQGLLRVCCESKADQEKVSLLIDHLPTSFWGESVQSHPNTFQLWLDQQPNEVVSRLVKKMTQSGIADDHPFFGFRVTIKHRLKESTQEIILSNNRARRPRKM